MANKREVNWYQGIVPELFAGFEGNNSEDFVEYLVWLGMELVVAGKVGEFMETERGRDRLRDVSVDLTEEGWRGDAVEWFLTGFDVNGYEVGQRVEQIQNGVEFLARGKAPRRWRVHHGAGKKSF